MAVAWIIDRMRDARSRPRPIWVAALESEFTAGGVEKLMKLSVCYGEGCSVCAQLERNYPAKGKCYLICKWEDKCIYQDPLFVSMRELFLCVCVAWWKTQMVVLKWTANRRLVQNAHADIKDVKAFLRSWRISVHTVTLCKEQAEMEV